jgi:hypothetical protein
MASRHWIGEAVVVGGGAALVSKGAPTLCRVSDLDSNEHYYGRPERLGDSESLQAKPKVAPTADSRTPSSRTRSQKLVQPPQPEGQGDMGSPKPPGLVGGDAAAGESPVTNSRGEEVCRTTTTMCLSGLGAWTLHQVALLVQV